ncbi:MAG TPA: twin-arginine translocation signal domain-containing protein [Longimicrobium sp.]|jgi:hypothetical protein|nr:twin-arginine translocation signal domain-containing protein [Longimicrobium sp.]
MSDSKDAVLPELVSTRPANRREFLGKTAVAAAAAAGIPALLAACGESATASDATRGATPAAPAAGGIRASLAGGRNFGQTVSKMVAGTIGSAPDCKIPALEKGVSTNYLQRIVTDSDRTGTGLATVLKGVVKNAAGVTVQIVVQDSRGRVWPARSIVKQSDLAYAMKDAMATNPNHLGVHRASLTAGSHVVSISKSHIVQFEDGVASDIYGNHNDVMSRGLSDIFNTSVAGYPIAATTHDPVRC